MTWSRRIDHNSNWRSRVCINAVIYAELSIAFETIEEL